LKNGAKPEKPAAPKVKKSVDPAGPSLLERFLAARAKIALDVFNEMDPDQRAATYEQFKAQATGRVPPLEQALERGVTRTALSQWYANDLWGEPTVEKLSHFADRSEVLL
jgi:hypothetical protein